ncbi:hypothetical protein L484_005984 [Morus notabilis]|uniref:Uncharacterized protein n=1 Tax=Morus notabilis TaxID=981085 RepID=W9S3I2_9ROSA|nr:hypothetical protein L484_005984 [Morus notabilis]
MNSCRLEGILRTTFSSMSATNSRLRIPRRLTAKGTIDCWTVTIMVVEVLMVMVDTSWYDDRTPVLQLNTGRYHDWVLVLWPDINQYPMVSLPDTYKYPKDI